MSISYRGSPQSIDGPTKTHTRTSMKETNIHSSRLLNITVPVSVAIHECELKSNEAVEVGVIVPGSFVQEEDVPVRGEEHEAGEAVEAAEHDARSTLSQKQQPQK